MKRRITTILAADIASFSRLVAEDEDGTLQRLNAHQDVFIDVVTRSHGRVFNTAGDSIMCEFESPVDAVRAAIDIQEALRTRNLAFPPARWLQFRIGVSMATWSSATAIFWAWRSISRPDWSISPSPGEFASPAGCMRRW